MIKIAELKVRNIEPYIIKKIDELAKQKSLSRNQYLKNVLESFSYLQIENSEKTRVEKQLEMNNILMGSVIDKLDFFSNILEKLLDDE